MMKWLETRIDRRTPTQLRRLRMWLRHLSIWLAAFGTAGFAFAVEEGAYLLSAVPLLLITFSVYLEFVFSSYYFNAHFSDYHMRAVKHVESILDRRDILSIKRALQDCIDSFRAVDKSQVCAVTHVVVDMSYSPSDGNRYKLLQLHDYVGSYSGSSRKYSLIDIYQGIIGRCCRTGCQEYVTFFSRDEYLERMTKEFGFSAQESISHRATARSYLARPIFRSGLGKGQAEQVVAVAYFFSSEPGIFPYCLDSAFNDKMRTLEAKLERLSLV